MSNSFSTGDFFLRSPVFSVNGINHLPENLPSFFAELTQEDFFLNAICVASSQLYEEAIKWKSGYPFSKKEEHKLMLSLFRYWLRMSTRCTPYGAFAGCAWGQVEERTEIILDQKENHQYHSRIDMGYMAELVEMIKKHPNIKSNSKYFSNNSLYKTHENYRYIEVSNGIYNKGYKVSEVVATDYLDTILSRAKNGAKINVLAELLVNDEISYDDAMAFVDELIDNKILISELEPLITGEASFEFILNIVKSAQDVNEILTPLQKIKELLEERRISVQTRDEIHHLVKSVLQRTAGKDLIQTDLFLSAKTISIKKEIADYIINSTLKFYNLFGGESSTMRDFKNKFLERYEEQEMPLTHVLDPELGIGYDHLSASDDYPFLLHGINPLPKGNATKFLATNRLRDYQLKKLGEAFMVGAREIYITEDELALLSDNTDREVPDSMYIMGTLAGRNYQEIDNGDFEFYLGHCSGPSSANLIARFCYGDKKLTARMRDCLSEEEANFPDCIFAEVVHSPQARIGNVIVRPTLRNYEIPYVSNASVAIENQIHVNDLFITLKGREIILRSKKLNKRVIPRLSSAHNFRSPTSLPMYKFLCDLQFQNLASGFRWDWGDLNHSPYLPRVRYGKLILKRAQWTISLNDHQQLKRVDAASMNVKAYFSKYQAEARIPNRVILSETDNELLIDMTNENCLRILLDKLIKYKSVRLEEFIGNPEQCIVENEHGSKFANELILPIAKRRLNQQSIRTAAVDLPKPNLQRSFIIGSEWLYLKIYCGTKTGEKILKEIIKPMTRSLLDQRIVDKWFFVRYRDTDHHLRIRFHGKSKEFLATVLPQINSSLIEFTKSGVIHRIQLDTYQREIERYGEPTMELSEDIFYHDSDAAISLLDLIETDNDERFRWLYGLRGVDLFLNDFLFSMEEKISLLKGMSDNYLKEFSNEKILRKQINEKYRKETKVIFSCLNQVNKEIEASVEVFKVRSEAFAPIVTEIRKKLANKPNDINSLVTSYIHMFLNRIFRSDLRKQELVIHNFLFRYYQSSLAMQKASKLKT